MTRRNKLSPGRIREGREKRATLPKSVAPCLALNLNALSRAARGTVQVDEVGNPVWLNYKATNHLGTTFLLSGKQFQASDKASNGALQALLNDLRNPSRSPSSASAGWVTARHPSGRPLIVHALVLDFGHTGEVHAIIISIVPDDEPKPGPVMLRAAFQLTPAEARVALGIARGDALSAIAQTQGIALGTVRTQLKAIFAKTGTHRQAQLAALLSRMAIPIR
jgi:DNA-binding CsgD family transcriptional regulator